MDWIISNWYMILATVCLVVYLVIVCRRYLTLPTDTQIQMVKEWLLYAVVMAEKELGDGTGKLKLRYVYDLFVSKFSFLIKIVPFDVFSHWVDDALEEMKRLLETNDNIKHFVEGDN